MNDTEFSNKVLGIYIFPIYLLIAFVAFFVFALIRVEAASLQISKNFISNQMYYYKASQTFTTFTVESLGGRDFVVNVAYGTDVNSTYSNYLNFSVPTKLLTDNDVFVVTYWSKAIVPSTYQFAIYDRTSGYIQTEFVYCETLSNIFPLENVSANRLTSISCSIPKSKDLSSFKDLYIRLYTNYIFVPDTDNSYSAPFITMYQDYVTFTKKTSLDTVVEAIEKAAKDIVDAINGEGQDIADKEPVDDSGMNDYKDAEGNLINNDGLGKIDGLNVSIDSKSNTVVWNIVTRSLNTHTKIFAMVIAILGVGIIKLILNR